jgi:DNA polymerase-1
VSGPVVLLDALSALHRAFHALPPMTTAAGEPTGALYGVCSLLLLLEREHGPSGWALAFDLPGRSERREAFPAYKAHRSRAPSPLVAQIGALWDLARALGVPAHAVPGWEADDVLATLAARLPGERVVVSGDTDLLQLLRPGVTGVLLGQRGRKNVHLDADAFRARYGYPPASVPAFKAMVGDPSDGLPGVPGLGAASAKALCTRHGDATGILAALDAGAIGNRRLPPILQAHRAELLHLEGLARLRDDLPLAEPLVAPIDREGFATFLARWEMRSLLERLGR